jgi:hypothetical protein
LPNRVASSSLCDDEGHRAADRASIHALARQWDDLTCQIDDGGAYRQAEIAAPPFGGDERVDRL